MTPLARTAWLAVALLWPVALLNYLDRQMLAAVQKSVMADIPDIATQANWGWMLGQFKWVYAVFSPVGGYVADRFSRKFTICGSLVVWSAVTWATGQVTTYQELLWTRTLMGVSEAFYIPAALALIADYHRGGTRARAVGVHQTGIYVGQIVGGFTGYAADAPALGWRFAFDLTGLAGVVYAVPLLLFLRDAPRSTDAALPKPSVPTAAAALFTNRSFVLLVLYFTLPAMAAWVIRDWGPKVLQTQFNISQGLAGVSATLYVQLASLGGAFLAGYLADRAMRRTDRGRIHVSAVGTALLIPALFGIGNAGTLTAAVLFLMLFGLGWSFFDCNNMPILSQVVRPELRATGYGVMNFVSISGGGVADWLFGRLLDDGIRPNAIFSVLAGVCVASLVLVLLIRPKPSIEAVGRVPGFDGRD